MNYVRIKAIAEGDAANFKQIRNFEDSFELSEGMSLKETFPEDAEYRMDDDFPDSVELHDMLHNLNRQLIANTSVRDFLDENGVNFVEYLPVNIINHKGRKVPEEYFIVNMLRHEDCIDQEKTQFKWNPLDDELMSGVSNLTVNEDRINSDALLFRLKYLSWAIVIRRDLADKLKETGFKGFNISEIKDIKS